LLYVIEGSVKLPEFYWTPVLYSIPVRLVDIDDDDSDCEPGDEDHNLMITVVNDVRLNNLLVY